MRFTINSQQYLLSPVDNTIVLLVIRSKNFKSSPASSIQTVAVFGLNVRPEGCGGGADMSTLRHSKSCSFTPSATASMVKHCSVRLESENMKTPLSGPKSAGAVGVC